MSTVKAVCADGVTRSARLSPSGADTFFSIPASVSVRGKTVTGFVTRDIEDDPTAYRFVANQYGKNASQLPRGAHKTTNEGT